MMMTIRMTAMVRRHNQTSAMILIMVDPDAEGMTVSFRDSPGGPAGPTGPRPPCGPVLPVAPAGPDWPVWPVAPCEGTSGGMVDAGHGTQSLVSFTYLSSTVSTYALTEKS